MEDLWVKLSFLRINQLFAFRFSYPCAGVDHLIARSTPTFLLLKCENKSGAFCEAPADGLRCLPWFDKGRQSRGTLGWL